MDAFIEAIFLSRPDQFTDLHWVDESNDSYFVFSSGFGAVRLRKRNNYPGTFAHLNGSVLQFGYGRADLAESLSHGTLRDKPEHIFYDDEFLLIEVDPIIQRVFIQRDAYGTVPLFVGKSDNKFAISNHYERTYQLLDLPDATVNLYAMSQFLLDIFTYANTLEKNIRLLFDRARLTWVHNELTNEFAPDGSVLTISNNRDGNAQYAGRILEKTLDDYWNRYGGSSIGAELSCGVDTSIINGYYANKQYPLDLATLIYPGKPGATLETKLQVFAENFGLTSTRLPIDPATEYPLANVLNSRTRLPFHFHEDIYTVIFTKLADYFAEKGVDVVFRGYGGDELCENIITYDYIGDKQAELVALQAAFKKVPYLTPENTDIFDIMDNIETIDGQTVPVVSVPHIRTNISNNNIYLDRGIWPVSPLADPRLYLYFQSLPIRYRHNKNILRAYHRARNYPPTLSDKSTNDDFAGFFEMSVSKNLGPMFSEILPSSVLAANGLLDKDRLFDELAFAETHFHGKKGGIVLFNIYKIAVLEIIFKFMGVKDLHVHSIKNSLQFLT